MIQDLPCLWQQLDGPQAAVLIQVLCAKWKQDYETTLEYFNNLKLDCDTLTSAHISTLGLLMGILHPVYYSTSAKDGEFTFLYRQEQVSNSGFGDPEGGILTDEPAQHNHYKVTQNTFRELLQLIANSDAQEGSLFLVDQICNYFFGVEYRITWGGYGAGQITISTPYTYLTLIPMVQSILDIYKPVCEIILEASNNWEA